MVVPIALSKNSSNIFLIRNRFHTKKIFPIKIGRIFVVELLMIQIVQVNINNKCHLIKEILTLF